MRAGVTLYRENIIGFENLADLSATGSFVMGLPMTIEGGSGGPLRVVAFVPATATGARKRLAIVGRTQRVTWTVTFS